MEPPGVRGVPGDRGLMGLAVIGVPGSDASAIDPAQMLQQAARRASADRAAAAARANGDEMAC